MSQRIKNLATVVSHKPNNMRTVNEHWMPWAALVAAAGISQWLLGEIRFSSGKAEAVFRALFFVPAVVDTVLLFRRQLRGGAAWRLWALVVPIWLIVAMMSEAFTQKDAQGAILIVMLPFGHAVMSAVCYLVTRPCSPGGSE